MKTQVEFRSSKFPPYEGEEEEINPGLWGKRLTEFLAQRLAEHGIVTDEMSVEDWGCRLPVRGEGSKLALCCGHQNGDDDQFLVFTDPSTPESEEALPHDRCDATVHSRARSPEANTRFRSRDSRCCLV